MAFAILNTQRNKDTCTLAIDALLISTTLAICALALAHIIPLKSATIPVCVAGSLFIFGIVLADILASLKTKPSKEEQLKQDLKKARRAFKDANFAYKKAVEKQSPDSKTAVLNVKRFEPAARYIQHYWWTHRKYIPINRDLKEKAENLRRTCLREIWKSVEQGEFARRMEFIESHREQIMNPKLLKREHAQVRRGITFDKDSRVPFTVIFDNLFLGNYLGFVTSCFCEDVWISEKIFLERTVRPLKKVENTQNKDGFQTILTACELDDITSEATINPGTPTPNFKELFLSKGIEWHYLGVEDTSKEWPNLVKKCTAATETDELIPIEKQFEMIFRVLDEALFSNKKTLVHCQRGASRSAMVIAAYLVNRFDVSAHQAIAFLQSKRPCVSPSNNWEGHLATYHTNLRQARLKKPEGQGETILAS